MGGVLDVARLAVEAVLGIDLEALAAAVLLVNILVDTGGAEAVLGAVIDLVVLLDGDVDVLERQMHRLVVIMVGARAGQVLEQVKGDLAIWLGVVDRRALRSRLERAVVGMAMLERERLITTGNQGNWKNRF